MFALWTFRSYLMPNGRDAIADWYGEQGEEVQGALDVAIEFLAQRPRDQWRRPHFDLLSGNNMNKIGEIRLKVEGIQYRILGFFGPSRSDFTLLIGANKKGNNYEPKSAFETARKRRDEVLANGSRCHVFDC